MKDMMTSVVSIAVYELLLGEGLEFASFGKVGTLEGTDSRKRPA